MPIVKQKILNPKEKGRITAPGAKMPAPLPRTGVLTRYVRVGRVKEVEASLTPMKYVTKNTQVPGYAPIVLVEGKEHLAETMEYAALQAVYRALADIQKRQPNVFGIYTKTVIDLYISIVDLRRALGIAPDKMATKLSKYKPL